MLRDQTFKPHAACRLEQNLALLEWRHEDPLGPPVGADNFLNFPRHIAKVQPLRAMGLGLRRAVSTGPANCRSGQPPTTPSRCSLLAVTAGLQMIAHHGLRLAQPASIMIVMRWIGYTVLVDKTSPYPFTPKRWHTSTEPPASPTCATAAGHLRRAEASSARPRRRRTTIGDSDVRSACGPSTRGRDPSQPCFTIGHALSLRGRAASSAGTVASSLR